MKTWVMRKMGDAWDPERFCPYTGRTLWQFPIPSHPLPVIWPEPWAMGYWRDDGVLMRVRRPTVQEHAWLDGFPAEYAKQSVAFHAWLEGVRKKD